MFSTPPIIHSPPPIKVAAKAAGAVNDLSVVSALRRGGTRPGSFLSLWHRAELTWRGVWAIRTWKCHSLRINLHSPHPGSSLQRWKEILCVITVNWVWEMARNFMLKYVSCKCYSLRGRGGRQAAEGDPALSWDPVTVVRVVPRESDAPLSRFLSGSKPGCGSFQPDSCFCQLVSEQRMTSTHEYSFAKGTRITINAELTRRVIKKKNPCCDPSKKPTAVSRPPPTPIFWKASTVFTALPHFTETNPHMLNASKAFGSNGGYILHNVCYISALASQWQPNAPYAGAPTLRYNWQRAQRRSGAADSSFISALLPSACVCTPNELNKLFIFCPPRTPPPPKLFFFCLSNVCTWTNLEGLRPFNEPTLPLISSSTSSRWHAGSMQLQQS